MRWFRVVLACLPFATSLAACSGAPKEDVGQTEEALSTSVVISQVYGAGGNSGALYASDFVELYNRGSTTVSLSGWSVQYASATGTSWTATPLGAKSIPPGGHFLVQLYTDSTSTAAAIPTPDATGTINMAAASGRVALANVTTALGCSLSCAGNAKVVDYVGYGLAIDYEGSGPAPLGSALTSVVRGGGGCNETDDNSADFATSVPSPHNSSGASVVCPGVDAGPDTGEPDTGPLDTGTVDTGTIEVDSGTVDTGTSPVDTGTVDMDSSTPSDSGSAGDASMEAAPIEDSGAGDAIAPTDTGTTKKGSVADLPTASPCGCRTPGAPVPFGLAPVFLAFVVALSRRRR
jgi:hypothetical protein